ncbi:MAG: tyrosine-type recombinase/integrase [Solirubrobacteraceae bacterium]
MTNVRRSTSNSLREIPRNRHTFLTRMVRNGSDLVLVAELAGHRRLETTRRYSLQSDVDRLLAVENLQIDY